MYIVLFYGKKNNRAKYEQMKNDENLVTYDKDITKITTIHQF